MSAPDVTRAHEIQRIESEMDRERTRMNLATARMAWTDAKAHAGRLVDLEAELAAVRSKPTETNVVGRFRVNG